ncbi:MAG: hypothetical protein A4E20_10935 [Nitrospira sp. SG-bin2]|uniref:hypothetical protein n=1 Tax=Nitrospira cf. moscoviensis SBR1015 TaxID=96242 RepID=UPI000A0AA7FE|nr:hypothetical protein [Nitrospira cf. moscoviensis SBR1015]OQW34527.1 MAG: hypothetical protein A4E20_10935 [Nitrospira sp. SG-bin2]
MKLTELTKYTNALLAFLGALVTFLTGIQANEAITNVAPSSWTYGIGTAVSVLTGVLVQVKGSQADPQLEALVEQIKAALATHNPEAVVAALPPAVQDVVEPVTKQVTETIPVLQKNAQDVLDEVTKAIEAYRLKF